MTNHIEHFERKRETEASKFRLKFKDKKYKLGVDAIGNIVNCETPDTEIIQWLKNNGLDKV